MKKQHISVAPFSFFAIIILLTSITSLARAEVTLLDKDEWKIGFSGFAEFDSTTDNTRKLGEIEGNAPVAKRGSSDTESGRTQFSVRFSRLGFSIVPPVTSSGWKSKGILEFDFLTSSSVTTTSATEAAGFNNPGMRIRQFYFYTENNGLQFMAGQAWSLFGWQPTYIMSTITVAPISGQLFERHARAGVLKTLALNDDNQIQLAASLSRPAQRDGDLPNLDLGVRWSNSARKSGYTGTYADIKTQPMSIGISSTTRQFKTPASTTAGDHLTAHTNGIALDGMIPIIASSDGKDSGNTLSLSGEFTTGKGYADMLTGWTGGTASGTYGSASNQDYLDSGFGAMNSVGNFEFFNIKTFNLQLQYTLPSDWQSLINVGYGKLTSGNAADFIGGTTAGPATLTSGGIYDKSESYFANILHDFTPQIRGGLEYSQLNTHFLDDTNGTDKRLMISAWFRF